MTIEIRRRQTSSLSWNRSISTPSAIRLLLFYDLPSWINNGLPDNSSSSRVKTYPLRWCANVIYNSRAGLRVRSWGSFLMRCKLKNKNKTKNQKQDNSTGPTLWLALLSARAAFQLKESKKTRQETTAMTRRERLTFEALWSRFRASLLYPWAPSCRWFWRRRAGRLLFSTRRAELARKRLCYIQHTRRQKS